MHIPVPVAMGRPSQGFSWYWSIYKWIDGVSANSERQQVDKDLLLTVPNLCSVDMNVIALECAAFLNELHKVDINGAPLPGAHNFFRGAHPKVYEEEVYDALRVLPDVEKVASFWEQAMQSQNGAAPVWIHGDLASWNIIIKDGYIAGVIDFGGMSIGDCAGDLI